MPLKVNNVKLIQKLMNSADDNERWLLVKIVQAFFSTWSGKVEVFQIISNFLTSVFFFWSKGTNQGEGAEAESQSPSGKGKQRRSQILGELYRVKKELIDNSNIVTKQEV